MAWALTIFYLPISSVLFIGDSCHVFTWFATSDGIESTVVCSLPRNRNKKVDFSSENYENL